MKKSKISGKDSGKDIPMNDLLDILYKGDWEEFENNFEEGWNDQPHVFCLANHDHHLRVAAAAAYKLSTIFESQDQLYCIPGWEYIAQKAYNRAAEDFYPDEKLWPGTACNDPEFWREHLRGASKEEIKAVWNEKEWGPFNNQETTWQDIVALGIIPEGTRLSIENYHDGTQEYLTGILWDIYNHPKNPKFKLTEYSRMDFINTSYSGLHILVFKVDSDPETFVNEVITDTIPDEDNPVHVIFHKINEVIVIQYYQA